VPGVFAALLPGTERNRNKSVKLRLLSKENWKKIEN
jgi:hypothetical protein